MLVGGRGSLLERERELEVLRGLLGRGVVGLLTGPPGIGKTRLARALREEAEEAGHRVLTARGAELERDYAFGVVRQWFEPFLRAGEALEGAAGLAAPALLGEGGQGHDASFSVLHGLYWFVAGLAEATPLLLVLDDAQWSDEASLRFAGFLARRLEGLPVLLLLTARAPVAGAVAELAADPAAEMLELTPLGLDAVVALLRDRVGGSVDEAFARACLEATGGNPFLLGELAHALIAENVEFVEAERGRVPTVGPNSVAVSVQLRLARLPAAASRLARAAAVAGDDAPVALVASLATLDEEEAETAADELARAGVLDDGRPLRFTHPIVAAAIRESLLAGERQALHAHAAELLAHAGASAEAISIHLLALEPAGDASVVATLLDAAEHAFGEGAPESAARLLERALAEPPGKEQLPRVLLALGEAEHVLDRPTATARLREAHRLARDPRERARAALLLTWAIVSRPHEPRDVRDLLERSADELAGVDRDLALRLDAAWLGVAWDSGDLDAILAREGRYSGLAGATPGECLVLAILAHTLLDDGRPAGDIAALALRAARLEHIDELTRNSIFLIHTGAALAALERLDLQLRLSEAAIAEAQARGSLRAYLQATMNRAAALVRSGDVRGAEADGWAALEGHAREVVSMPAVGVLVTALTEQSRFGEAVAVLEQHGVVDRLPEFRHGTVLLQGRARLRAAQGDTDGALADYAEIRRRLDRGRRTVVGLDIRCAVAMLRRARGEQEEAEQEAAAALEIARAWGMPGENGTVLHMLGVVHSDVDALREAAELLGPSPLRLRYAKALVDLGSTLRRAGARSDSRQPLREALALADELGAIAVRERAREELAASGVRARREAVRGVAALTPSERRIVQRAVEGASNPEIAQALFVTVKTVEMHLSNAYRKLGISNRRELSAALTPRG